jgi:hypothetical protein
MWWQASNQQLMSIILRASKNETLEQNDDWSKNETARAPQKTTSTEHFYVENSKVQDYNVPQLGGGGLPERR